MLFGQHPFHQLLGPSKLTNLPFCNNTLILLLSANAVQMAILAKRPLRFPPIRARTPWDGKEEREWHPELERLVLHCCSFDAVDRPEAGQALDALLAIKDLDPPAVRATQGLGETQQQHAGKEKEREREKKAD